MQVAEAQNELQEIVGALQGIDQPHSAARLPFLKSELTTIAVDLEDLNRRVRQLAERVALASDEVFSGESIGGNNGARPSLLSDAVETLLALPMSSEDAAMRRRREAINLLDRVAGLQEDAERVLLNRPEAVAHYLTARHGRVDQEIMGALYLDLRNRLIADNEVFRGTHGRAAVEPRAILREALALGAISIVLWHTHPSCDPTPSFEDFSFTKQMAKAGGIVGVRLVDHLILGGHRWISLKQRDEWRQVEESVSKLDTLLKTPGAAAE